MNPETIAGLPAQYKALSAVAQQRLNELYRTLSHLVEQQHLPLAVPIEVRVTTLESVIAKLSRGVVRLSDLRRLDDLTGVRLITLFRHDAERICLAIEKNLTILKAQATDHRLSADQFGYSSVHYVVSLPLGANEADADLRAEIQVRTLAEHLWASSSHILQYKKEASVPLTLRRSIHRVSALLEVVDAELDRLREEHQRAIETCEVSLFFEEDEGLSILFLQVLLEELVTDREATARDDFFGIMIEMLHLGIDKQAKVRALIERQLVAAKQQEQITLQELLRDPQASVPEKSAFRNAGVFLTKCGLVRYMLQIEFSDNYRLFDSRKMIEGGA